MPTNPNLRKINLFLQNKANFMNAEMNVSAFYTKEYENEIALNPRKTKPIQSQFFDLKPTSAPIMKILKSIRFLSF